MSSGLRLGQDYNTGLHCLRSAPAERNSSKRPQGLSSLWKYLALLVLSPPFSPARKGQETRGGVGSDRGVDTSSTRLPFWPLIVSAEGLAHSSGNTSDRYHSSSLFSVSVLSCFHGFTAGGRPNGRPFDSPADDTSSKQQKAERHPACADSSV